MPTAKIEAHALGIDLGTSKSCMAWCNPASDHAEVIQNREGQDRTPSVVYFGAGDALVGAPAEQMLDHAKGRKRIVFSPKSSLVGAATIGLPPSAGLPGRSVRAVEVAAAILAKLKRDAEQLHFNREGSVTRAVITCPAVFDQLERDAVREAGRLAGFTEVRLLDEPVAAARAYERAGVRVGNNILVCNLGAGTFDMALVSREDGDYAVRRRPKGLIHCAGDEFDRVLYEHCDQIALGELGRHISPSPHLRDLRFLRRCRERKELLSFNDQCSFDEYLLPDANGVRVAFSSTVRRADFEALIGGSVDETVRLTRAHLEAALAAGCRIDTVVLIGGSSRVPLVRQRLAEVLRETVGIEPQQWHRADVAVALGAAYNAASLWAGARYGDNGRPRRTRRSGDPFDAFAPGAHAGARSGARQPRNPWDGFEARGQQDGR